VITHRADSRRGRFDTKRLASIVTEVSSPGVLIVVQVLLAAWSSAPSAGRAVVFGGLAVVFASVFPMVSCYSARGSGTGPTTTSRCAGTG
jgi:hypothetical protein